MQSRDVALAFADLMRAGPGDAGQPAHLSNLLRYCVRLTGAVAANAVVTGRDGPVAWDSTDPPARALLALELRTECGPSLDCVRSGSPLGPVPVAERSPWPGIAVAARSAGYATVQSLPLRADPRPVGAVSLYSADPLDADQRDIVQALADSTGAVIAAARLYNEERRRAAQLQHALSSRVVIEQAKGVLAERHHVTVDAAFGRLRRQARSENQKIHDLAATVVSGASADPQA